MGLVAKIKGMLGLDLRERQLEVVVQRLYNKGLQELALEALALLEKDAVDKEVVVAQLQEKLQELQRKLGVAEIDHSLTSMNFDLVADYLKEKAQE